MGTIQVKKLHTFLGHNDSLYTLERMDGNRFFSAGSEGMVVLWDLRSPNEGEVIIKIPGSIYAMAYDETKAVLFIGQNNEGIHKIDLSQKKEMASVSLGKHQIFDIQLFENRLWVALETGEIVQLSENLEIHKRKKFSNQHSRTIDFGSGRMAVGFSDHTTKIIDLSTFEIGQELKGHKNSIFTVKYHPSGKYLITGGRDAQLKVWDTSANYVLRESIAAHLYTINHLVFSRDGKYFVSCSMDKSLKLWNAHNFKLLRVIDKYRYAGHGNSINKLLWMKYHDLLVSCSDDRTISVWEIALEE